MALTDTATALAIMDMAMGRVITDTAPVTPTVDIRGTDTVTIEQQSPEKSGLLFVPHVVRNPIRSAVLGWRSNAVLRWEGHQLGRHLMDPVSRTAAILLTFAGASLTAVAVGYIAHYDMGFTREEIRTFSVADAIILATLMATEYFGKKFRKLK